jgi:hypothetical protein
VRSSFCAISFSPAVAGATLVDSRPATASVDVASFTLAASPARNPFTELRARTRKDRFGLTHLDPEPADDE